VTAAQSEKPAPGHIAAPKKGRKSKTPQADRSSVPTAPPL